MAGIKRVSVSLPTHLADDVDYVSSRLGMTRSAFITQFLLGGELDKLRSILSAIPEDPSEADVKRYRGDSRAYIADQLAKLQELQGGLFDDSSC